MKTCYLLLLALLATATTDAVAQRKPNIIFILVDDQGYGDLGAFFQNQRAKANDPSQPWQVSPNLDKLANSGARLTDHYCAAPVCAPSRASILLGVSQGHANVRDNQFDKALENNYTMPSTLRQLGYRTAMIGKWGLQGADKWEKNGSSWPAHPLKRGFDYALSYMRHGDGHEHYPKEGPYGKPKQVWENYTNIAGGLDKCYTADLWTAAAKKFIIGQQDAKQPFFLYLAYETPHAILQLPTGKYPAGGGLTGGLQWLGTPGHMINTAEGTIDSYVQPEYANATYDDDKNPATPEVPWPDTYKRYATANRRIDDGVGDLVQLLHDLKIDSNTVIVYTSDNGPSLESYLPKTFVPNKPTFFGSYGPFDGVKRDDLEGGVRVPAIVNWPGRIPAGRVVSTPSISYDWAPTFIEMAGALPPARMDGTSRLPILTGKGTQLAGTVYNEYFNEGKTPDYAEFEEDKRGRQRNQMQFVRLGNYVGVRYDVKSAEDVFAIYNVMADPKQKKNLAANPSTSGTGSPRAIQAKLAGNPNATLEAGELAVLQSVMQATVLQSRRPDSAAPRPYDAALIPPAAAGSPAGSWSFYPGSFEWLPQTATIKPAATGKLQGFALPAATAKRSGVYCLEGYLTAPADGAYTISLQSTEKALLRIHQAQLIDADFDFAGSVQKSATILLKAGQHPYRFYIRARNEKQPVFSLSWSGPGFNQTPLR